MNFTIDLYDKKTPKRERMCVLSTYKGYSRCSKWCPPMATHARHLLIIEWHVHLTISEDSRSSLRCKSATGEECTDAMQIRDPSEVPKEENCVASCRRTLPTTHQKLYQDTRGQWVHNGVVRHCAFQLLKREHCNTEHCCTRPYVSDERILKTISNEHLPHFVGSPLLDSVAELMPHPVCPSLKLSSEFLQNDFEFYPKFFLHFLQMIRKISPKFLNIFFWRLLRNVAWSIKLKKNPNKNIALLTLEKNKRVALFTSIKETRALLFSFF